MKKSNNYLIAVFVTILSLSACKKDSINSISGPIEPVPVPEKIVASGNAVELGLVAYSSLESIRSFELSVQAKTLESFQIAQSVKKDWHLNNLSPGTYRININVGYGKDNSPGFCNFQFTVSDDHKTQSVTATRINSNNYGFDLVVQ